MARHDLEITEGVDYSFTMNFKKDDEPLDLTGYSFQSEIRTGFDEGAPVLAEFVIAIVDAQRGEVSMSLSAQSTQDIIDSESNVRSRTRAGFYDVFYLNPTGNRRYLMGGQVTVIQTITRRPNS